MFFPANTEKDIYPFFLNILFFPLKVFILKMYKKEDNIVSVSGKNMLLLTLLHHVSGLEDYS